MKLEKKIVFRFLRILILNLLFLVFVDELNDIFSPSAYIIAPALYIIAPALFLGTLGAFFVAIIMGFFCSVSIDTSFGVLPILFGIASIVVSRHRSKFRNLESTGIILLSWGVNMSIFVLAVLFAFTRGVAPYSSYMLRVFVDAVFSSMFIIIFSAFAVNLQRSLAYLFGDDLNLRDDS